MTLSNNQSTNTEILIILCKVPIYLALVNSMKLFIMSQMNIYVRTTLEIWV